MSELSILSDLREMIVWVYSLTNTFPESEKFGLTNQMRRAIVSVSLNIREGNAYRDKNKRKFFYQAFGSLHEVEECFKIAKKLGFFYPGHIQNIVEARLVEKENEDRFYEHYWKCFNKLNSLIKSSHSGDTT